jgi:hypothetical protein
MWFGPGGQWPLSNIGLAVACRRQMADPFGLTDVVRTAAAGPSHLTRCRQTKTVAVYEDDELCASKMTFIAVYTRALSNILE